MNVNYSEDASRLEAVEYQEFSRLLKVLCGIDLGENKQYLVATRVRKILNQNGLSSLAELTRTIQKDSERILRQQVIDAMTTNETFWFRDNYPYDYLAKTYLPLVTKNHSGQKLKIWSAACSTGQEPYSISMVVDELNKSLFGRGCEADILATDLSSTALDSARNGVYDRISVARGLSEERIKTYFEQKTPDAWHINQEIKKRIRFRAMNLQDSYYLLGRFDIIFCRNVLIYFSTELKKEILTKLHAALTPGGLLFLGSSESITGLNHLYEMINCQPGVAYRAIVPKK